MRAKGGEKTDKAIKVPIASSNAGCAASASATATATPPAAHSGAAHLIQQKETKLATTTEELCTMTADL